MNIYKVIWNHEPPRFYLAKTVQQAIAKDVEAVRREWDEGENIEWTGDAEYQEQFTSVELVGELYPEPKSMHPLHVALILRITELARDDPPAQSPNGYRLAELASQVEQFEKSQTPVLQHQTEKT